MSKPAKLTFIVANGTSEILPELQDGILRSWLARAAGRGVLRRADRDASQLQDHLDFEVHLLAAIGLLSHAKTLASAPVCLAAERLNGFWFRAEPIHFAAGMTRIDAVMLKGAAALSAEDRDELSMTIGDHLHASGLQWDARRWLVGYPRALDVQTREPNLATELQDAMPSGADAKQVRRLMTELQMVLHEHPVNVRRARAGLPAANAVWVWGGGSVIAERRNSTSSLIFATDPFSPAAKQIATEPFASSPKIFATDPFSLGLAHLTGTHAITPENPEQVLSSSSEDRVVVLDLQENTDLFGAWLRPLQTALAKGRLSMLCIAIDRWTIELTRTSLWRVWRTDLSLERWSAA
jgi:hypothetical protein